jgi:hypothetical protein
MLVNASKNIKRLSWEMSDRAVPEVSAGIGIFVGVEVGGIDVGEGGTGVSVGATIIVVAVGVAVGSAFPQPTSKVRIIVTVAITL